MGIETDYILANPPNYSHIYAANLAAYMKKVILALGITVTVMGFSSCTKLYNCNCTTTTTDTLTKEKITTAQQYKLSEKSKKLADAKCQQNAFTYNDNANSYSSACTLEAVKN